LKGSELKKILKQHGCRFHRHGGEHDVWMTADGKKIRLPRHDSAEVPTGTADKILKAAGVR